LRRLLLLAIVAILGAGVAYVGLTDGPSSFAEGLARQKAGDRTGAVPFFERWVREQPEHALGRYYLGHCLWSSGRTDEGIAQIRKAGDLDPDLAAPQLFLAAREEEAGEFEKALARYHRAGRVAAARLGRARVWLALGRTGRAMEALREPMLAGGETAGRLLLADLFACRYHLFGREADSAVALRLCRSVEKSWQPPDPPAVGGYRHGARAALGAGQTSRALYRAVRAVDLSEDSERPRSLILLARVRIALGDETGAAEELLEAEGIDASPRTALAIAELLVLEGDRPNAAYILRRALESHPGEAEIEGLIEALAAPEIALRRPELAALATEIRDSGADLSLRNACMERLGRLADPDPLDPESILVAALLPEGEETPDDERSRYVARARDVLATAADDPRERARLTVLLRRYDATARRLTEALREALLTEDSER
jgi:tetratricopeptide (TPR) repeat protein